MAEKIVLMGAGALARDIVGIFGPDRFLAAFVDPQYRGEAADCEGLVISTDWEQLMTEATHYALGVSEMKVRELMSQRARAGGLLPMPPLFARGVYCAPSAKIGAGSMVGNFSSIGPDVELAEDVVAMHNVNIGHNSRIDALSVLCPGVTVGGYAQLGKRCFVGGNAVFAPGVKVGDGATIAAGASCLSDVPEQGFAIGSPARRVARPS